MTRDVELVAPDETVQGVARLMADHDAGSPELLARRRALGERRIESVGARMEEIATRARDG